jgi:hypothetical protein
MRRFIVALVAVFAGLVGPGVVLVAEAPAANADTAIIKWYCHETDWTGGYWMPTKSWRGCVQGYIVAYDVNSYPVMSQPKDGWDGGCTNAKFIAGWGDSRIRSYCRLREFGGTW